jgi:hypothetical protein
MRAYQLLQHVAKVRCGDHKTGSGSKEIALSGLYEVSLKLLDDEVKAEYILK